MLYFFSGTDREKTRAALGAAIAKHAKKRTRIVRITDASTVDDLRGVLRGPGMFDLSREGGQLVVLDGVLGSDEMRPLVERELPRLAKSAELVFMREEKVDAATRKLIEKYAEDSKRFDAAKKEDRGTSIFALANALRAGDKKKLWLALQRELIAGKEPEAVHGVLFWGAKDLFLKARTPQDVQRAAKLVALLAQLPHESRRRGIELEYTLEHFALSGA